MSRRALLLLTLMMLVLMAVASPAWATTFTVNSTADTGDTSPDGTCGTCTLREAIEEANANNNDEDDPPVTDTIAFAIPGAGPHTITPASLLPTITEPLVIDGYSQGKSTSDTVDDAKPNTRTVGTNAVLKIVLDGTFLREKDSGHAIKLAAANSTIKGLVINHGFSEGVLLHTSAATGNKVEGNFIGTDVTGTQPLGNSSGVFITGNVFSSASGNVIGGTTLAARNVISGNFSPGVVISGFDQASSSDGNKVQGNLIGPDVSGVQAFGNGLSGVRIAPYASNNLVGGTEAGAGNVISGNGNDGVSIGQTSNGVSDPGATGNRILSNSIFSNGVRLGGIGINLLGGIEDADERTENDPKDSDVGSNLLQNYPEVTTAKPVKKKRKKFTLIRGTLNSTPGRPFTIQLFRNPSGEDEGKTLLTQFTRTTDATSGDASFSLRVPRNKAPVGSNITATATDASGNTSEFSLPKTVGS